jgi:Zn-dependent protease with chaperone function
MNFFKDQKRAKEQTRKLVFLFALNVLATAFFTGFISSFYLILGYTGVPIAYQQDVWYRIFFSPVFSYVALSTAFVIISVSLIKILLLGKGGEYVARLAGAETVPLSSQDPLLRRYINIIEEMSLASSTPMPKIYYMPREESINAFAAGYEINDAVIAVTQGALKYLTRDELQAVVAHEYGHIFNGDMKLNIKLIGYLYGLMFIAQIGSALMRSGRYHGRNRRNQGPFVGLILYLVGSLGMLLAKLIRAAISRQREYLADAASVQYTRNPDGIANALKKIMALDSYAKASEAEQIGHMFFAEPIKRYFNSFATHPPLRDRIKRINKKFDLFIFNKREKKEILQQISQLDKNEVDQVEKARSQKNDTKKTLERMILTGGVASQLFNAKESDDNISSLLIELKKQFNTELNSAMAARWLALSFFINHDEVIAKSQIDSLMRDLSTSDRYELYQTNLKLNQLKRENWLDLAELVAGRLNQLDKLRQADLLDWMKKMIEFDSKVELDEYLYYSFFRSILRPNNQFIQKNYQLSQIKQEVVNILYLFSRFCDHKDKTFQWAQSELKLNDIVPQKITINVIQACQQKLSQASLDIKQLILMTCKSMSMQDNRLDTKERELLKILSLSFGVPIQALD